MSRTIATGFSLSLLLLASVLSSCVSQSPEERIANMGPVHGDSEVKYMIASNDGGIALDNAVGVAQTIGRYRRLNVSESDTVRRLAQEKFDGFVLREVRNLQPAYESRKREIRARARSRISSSPSQAEIASIRKTEEKEIEKIDSEIRRQAVIAVKRQYGSQFAVPLKTRDNKPVVAIAKIQGDQVKAPTSAVQLNKRPGSSVKHEGKNTTVIGGGISIQP